MNGSGVKMDAWGFKFTMQMNHSIRVFDVSVYDDWEACLVDSRFLC